MNIIFNLQSTVSEVTVDPGIATALSQSVGSETNSNNLLLMKPPRSGSDIPRCSSVSSALPRPRPQVYVCLGPLYF